MSKNKNKHRSAGEVDKDFSMKIIEVLGALQLLRDSIRAVREGKSYHLAVLSGQLRGLLIDRTGHAERRLLYVAEQLGIPLNVYCMAGVDDPSFPLAEKPIFWISGFPISIERQLKNQRKMTLDQVLNEQFVLYDGIKYTPRTIIEWFANKAGGSHYSSSMPKHFAEMLTLQIGQIEPLRNMLLQLAEATLAAGVKLLKASAQQEMHLLLAVPSLPSTEAYLMDIAYPGSPMRWSLILNQNGQPIVRLIGIDGSWVNVAADRIVEWDRLRHIALSLIINDDLHTVIEMYIDGIRIGRVESEFPLYLNITHNWEKFDVFYNKAVSGEPQDFSLAVGEIVIVGAELSPTDRANMLLYEERKRVDENTQVFSYERLSFGYLTQGGKNLNTEGVVKKIYAKDILPK